MFKDLRAFLSSFLKKAAEQRLFRKYVGITLIAIFTFLIPALLIFCYLNFKEAPPPVEAPEISITIFDNDGHTIFNGKSSTENIESSPFIKTIYPLINTKSAVEKPENFKKVPTFNITVITDSGTSTFKCYFETDASQSFIEDANGTFFSPNESNYIEFLSTMFSQPVYPEATPPSLTLGKSTVILPSKIDWNYKLINGEEQKSENNELAYETIPYLVDGIVKFNFSTVPDECEIKIFDKNGTLVFEGTNEEILEFSANEGDEFNVSIHAKWNSSDDSSAYGEQTYIFDIICTKPSEIKVSSTSASGGRLIVLSVSNVNSAESIIYTPKEPTIPNDATDSELNALTALYKYEPVFTLSGQNAYALIPIPQDIPVSELEFSIAYGIAKSDFTISLTKDPISATIPAPKDLSLDIPSARKEFESTVASVCTKFGDILLFTSEFLSPEEYGFTRSIEYNSEILIDEESSFRFLANAYTASNDENVAVKSANIGTVRSVGYSELLGNYVVIDHGAGLYTWYCGLSEVGVTESDVLKKGEFIGRSGSTSPLCSNGVNIFCTLFGSLIDPTDIMGQKLI